MTRPRLILALAVLVAACGDSSGAGSQETETDASATTDASSSSSGTIDMGGGGIECGNGVVEAGEQCDGEAVGDMPCPEDCKYPEQTVLWEVLIDTDGGNDWPETVATTDAGDILIAGWTLGESNDGYVIKLDKHGNELWRSTLVSGTDTNGAGRVRVHPSGDLFAAGWSCGAQDKHWVARLDPDGGEIWFSDLLLADGVVGCPGVDMAWVPGPDALLTAEIIGPIGARGLVVKSVTSAGSVGDPVTLTADLAPPVRIEGGDQSVAFGLQSGPVGGTRWLLESRSHQLSPNWNVTNRSDAMDGAIDSVRDLELGTDGAVYGVGDQGDPASSYNLLVMKIEADGAEAWRHLFDSPDHMREQGTGVAVDEDGNVFVQGTLTSAANTIWLRKLGPGGDEIWTDVWTGEGMGGMTDDYGSDVDVDPQGFVIALGRTRTENGGYDILVRKIAP